jgi:glycerophosphoryl diester phosphodiesterase
VHPFLSPDTPFVMAHRGGPQLGDENSDLAFARSVALGVRYLESDVRTTADGVPILNHDPTLTRAALYQARVDELPWDEIARIELPEGGRILRLDEALTLWPGIRWNLDVKDNRSVAPTVEALRRAHALDRVCLNSFSNARVMALRKALGPEAATGATWREAAAVLRLPGAGRVLRSRWRDGFGPVAVQVPPSMRGVPLLTRNSVSAAHGLGLQVHAWVINTADQMRGMLDIGVDGLMTDDPATAVRVLRDYKP